MSRQTLGWVGLGVLVALVLGAVLYLVFGLPPGEAGSAGAGVSSLVLLAAKQRQEALGAARVAKEQLDAAAHTAATQVALVRAQDEEVTEEVAAMTPKDKAREGILLFGAPTSKEQGERKGEGT
jgi:hypothetical protein